MTKVLVTGISGFLGAALAKRLVQEGYEVHGIARRACPELKQLGVVTYQIDLTSTGEQLQEILDGVNAVFHVAAKVEMWGKYEDFFKVNVLGTRALLESSKKAGVRYFIYTSSPSVIAADGIDLLGINEEWPYPQAYEAHYPATKALAEQEIRSEEQMLTMILRPHLIFGAGDTNLIPTILKRARAGRLIQVGEGKNLSDFTYIDDCVQAHLLALKALQTKPELTRRRYFISQGDPVPLWEFVNKTLEYNALPIVSRKIPTKVAMLLAGFAELLAKYLLKNREPFLTRFLVSEMSTSHYFDISAAKRDLGYQPSRTTWQALEDTFS
jgi:nucleoside-diphosphate-sugar epimerase